jgi:uncharacterized protein (TIGR02117 family)
MYLIVLPLAYVLISLVMGLITVNKQPQKMVGNDIFLTTNGVHLDIVIPIDNIGTALRKDLRLDSKTQYLAFGWGDENFYLNTPTWADVTFRNAYSAMFLDSSTLMHVTQYGQKRNKWIRIRLSESQLNQVNEHIQNSFKLSKSDKKMLLKNKGYNSNDDFYRAKGSYSLFKTCNSWVNSIFKESNLKSCLWTPFDFALINKYK